jgi:alpha 1,6-mannosyltransferase
MNAIIERYLYKESKNTIIPRYIWQTYKTKDLPSRVSSLRNGWIDKNPDWENILYDDADIERYMKENWDSRMYVFYKALPLGVMKADLWRYLVLNTHGGVYSDIDSKCLLPINYWFHDFTGPNALIIGLENDTHFCQWTMYSTKNHPALKHVCNFILEKYEKDGIDLTNSDFVHATTGPAIWTNALKSYFDLEHLTNARNIYEMYKKDKSYFVSKGVYILSEDYFSTIYTNNQYGSNFFGDGYVKWTDEAAKLITK